MNDEFDIDNFPVIKLASELNKIGENLVDKVNNTSYNDVLRLRMEAAERGIEMTPQEVIDLISILADGKVETKPRFDLPEPFSHITSEETQTA